MTRRHRLIALVAAGATFIAGCGSGSDSRADGNVIAQVDDQTLDQATLEALVTSAVDSQDIADEPSAEAESSPEAESSTEQEYPTEIVGGAINLWVWNEAIRAELSDRGVQVPAATVVDPITIEALQADVQAAYTALSTYERERDWTDDELAARYDSVICINVATTETEADANDLIDALNAGTDFLAATEVGATSGSPLGCSAAEITTDFVNGTLAQANLTIDAADIESLQPGAAIGPWESQFGFVVLQRANLDEAVEMSSESFKVESVLVDVVAHHDISVNSIYGWFSAQGLQPLSS